MQEERRSAACEALCVVVNLSQQRLASFDREAKNIIELEELDSPTSLLKSRLDLSKSSLGGRLQVRQRCATANNGAVHTKLVECHV